MKIFFATLLFCLAFKCFAQDYCYLDHCMPFEKLYPRESRPQEDLALIKKIQININEVAQLIFEDDLSKNSNYGPTSSEQYKGHYHYFIFSQEFDTSLISKKYSTNLPDHNAKSCKDQYNGLASSMYIVSFNRLYQDSYVIGWRGEQARGAAVINFSPNNNQKSKPTLIKNELTVIY